MASVPPSSNSPGIDCKSRIRIKNIMETGIMSRKEYLRASATIVR
jgi:hypothetical protein